MAKLIYSAITSLDGYTADENGNFDWASPDDEVHSFVNDLERPIGTYLYGRKMYDMMSYWETPQAVSEQPAVVLDFATLWRAADKVVYSKTLPRASTEKTRLERNFDAETIRRMKASAVRDLSVGGANLAAQAFKDHLIDECHLFLNPIVVGGGNAALPSQVRLKLELLDEHRFKNGVIHLHYRIAR